MARRRRGEDRLTKILAGLILLAFITVCVGLNLAHSKLVYGNYRCAFAHCRIVEVQR